MFKGTSVLNSLLRYRRKESDDPKRNVPARPLQAKELSALSVRWNASGTERLTAGIIQRALSEANSGNVGSQAALFQKILEEDPVISAHLQTRIHSVLSCDWSVCGEDPDKVKITEKELRNAGIHVLLRHLLDALSFGYSGAAILWDEGGRSIREFQRIDPGNFRFDAGGNPALLVPGAHQEQAFCEFHPAQFVFHSHGLKADSPARGGFLRALAWNHFFKHYALRDRARYLERFGIPFIAAKLSAQDFESEETRTEVLASLGKLSSDGVGVLCEGSEMQILNPATSSSGDYQNWLDYLDRSAALMILGQTASSGDASGFSKGQTQENVRRDLVETDCRNLMETINNDVLSWFELYRFGTRNTLRFKLDFASPENLMERAAIVKTLADAGYHVTPEYLQNVFGMPFSEPLSKQEPQRKD